MHVIDKIEVALQDATTSVRAGLEALEDADYFVLGMKDSTGLDMAFPAQLSR